MFMQATNNAAAEETGCAKNGDDRCDHSVPDIVTVLLWTREDCDGSSGSEDPLSTSSLHAGRSPVYALKACLALLPQQTLWYDPEVAASA